MPISHQSIRWAAVERLDVRTERSTDTTTDTRVVELSRADVAVLL
jgi:hypothetical protein